MIGSSSVWLWFKAGSTDETMISSNVQTPFLSSAIFIARFWHSLSLLLFKLLIRYRHHTWISNFQVRKDHGLSLLSFCCFSVSTLCPTLWPHGLQHTRLPCPSLSPRVCSNKRLLSQWCHQTISSTNTPFSSCPQSFQHQGLFQMVHPLHQVAKVSELQLQHQYFQWIFRVDFS